MSQQHEISQLKKKREEEKERIRTYKAIIERSELNILKLDAEIEKIKTK